MLLQKLDNYFLPKLCKLFMYAWKFEFFFAKQCMILFWYNHDNIIIVFGGNDVNVMYFQSSLIKLEALFFYLNVRFSW